MQACRFEKYNGGSVHKATITPALTPAEKGRRKRYSMRIFAHHFFKAELQHTGIHPACI
jgi:hypothetical protein